MKHSKSLPCSGCNGTGQMTYFGGVSRFQFSYTDCPECNGVGFSDQTPSTFLQANTLKNNTSLSLEKADAFLKILAQILSDTLIQGEKIKLRGFGSFSFYPSGSKQPGKICFPPAKQLLKYLNP